MFVSWIPLLTATWLLLPTLAAAQAPAAPVPAPSPATAQGGAPTGRGQAQPQVPAWEAQARTDQNSQTAHQQLLAKRTQGKIDVYFAGDSIVRRWGATDYPQFLENWKQNFWGWNAADF